MNMATEGGVGAGGYGDRTATAHDNKRASGGGGFGVWALWGERCGREEDMKREKRVVLFCTGREELRACGAVCVARRVEKTR